MARRHLPPGIRIILLAPAMAAALVVLAAALRPLEEAFLHRHIREKLATLRDDEVTDLLADLTDLGDVGLATLTEALESERPAMAHQAHRALLAAIDEWELMASRQGATKLAKLADLLAHRTEHLGPAPRGLAADVAHRILLCSIVDMTVDRTRLVTDCRRVVQSTGGSGHGQYASSRWEGTEPARELAGDANRAMGDEPRDGLSPSMADPLVVPAAHASKDRAQIVLNDPEPPRRLRIGAETQPLPRLKFQDKPSYQGDLLRGLDRAAPEPSSDISEQPMEEPDVLAVMRRLHDPSPSTVAAAEAELARRGFRAEELELARAVTDSDAKVRRDCVDRLAAIPSLDAKPWLLWLSQDQDILVRLAALTWMATSRDPDLLRVVEQTALQDRDPRITALADRVIRERQKAAKR